MKKILPLHICIALLLAVAPLASQATTFFADTFSGGSTLTNLTPAAPTSSSTSYQLSSSKQVTSTNALPGFLKYGIATTTGGGVEVQALFTTSPVALVLIDDYIQLTVVFTNEAGLLTANGGMGFGLYNGGQVQPIAGGCINTALNTLTDRATGGVQNWQGYWGQLAFTGANSRVMTRPAQTTGTDNRNQNLTSTGSGSQSYAGPGGAVVGAQSTAPSVTLVPGQTYTAVLKIQLTAANTLAITNTLYSGPNTNGTVLSQFGGVASGATYLTSTFDALAIGWRAQANTTGGTVIDISSIKVDGVSTVITTPPDIVTQPVPVTVANGGSCAYSVVASGFGMTYQWKRYNTNLVNGGNISGATSDMLIISPASATDVASGADGYFVTVTGTGGYSTNSTKVALGLGTAKNLVWSGSGNVWDLNTSANWLDPINPATFNYGDAVTLGDAGAVNGAITLTGKYLSASSVTVDTSTAGYDYTFVNTSTGSFAGPGQLIYIGAGLLTLNNVNTYSGGTIISNSSAYLIVGNYNGLGSGPVTLAKAGGLMEVVPTGSASVGISGDVNVQDDFTIQFDGTGAFAGVVLGNLSGTVGKTLTLNPKLLTTTNRFRFYGANTTCDANLVLNGPSSTYAAVDGTTFAPYNGSGSQTYNGVISGNGGIIQRGGGTTILSGQNTYTGGTVPTTGTIGFGVDSIGTTVTSGPIGTGALLIAPELPNTTGSGTVLAWGGTRIIRNPIQYPSATNNQTLIIGGTNALFLDGPFTLNGNDGLGTLTNRTLQVNNTALTTIRGVISGAGFGLIKTGNGTLVLGQDETYTGATSINQGTLRLDNGSLDVGTVTVQSNATLSGVGVILGPVNVVATGILAPGNSIGTLTINNDLTLSGNLNIEVNRSGLANDKAVVSGILTNAGAGTVTVTNLGSALQAGDTFTLFNKPLTNGNALTITGSQVIWTNKLALDGTISVVSTVATNPTNINYSVSGNSLTLSWPPNYLTWSLQSNAVSVASSSNWFTVPGSSAVTQVVVTVNPARSNVFYRLIAP